MTGEEYNHINDVMQDLYQDGKLSEDDFDFICKVIDDADMKDKYRWHEGHPINDVSLGDCVLEILTYDGYKIVKYFPNDQYKFADISSSLHRGYKNISEIKAYRIHEGYEVRE